MWKNLIRWFVILITGATLPTAVFGQVIVTSTNDDGAGTLREAINNATNDETIAFATNLSGGCILLDSTLTINTNLTIDASALSAGIQINGQDSNEVFSMAGDPNVELISLTITNGLAEYGGAISNSGTMTLNQCNLSGNYGSAGGAIFNTGTITANQCSFSKNHAGQGGAIINSGTLTLNKCTLSGNVGPGFGGAIANNASLTLNQCTLAENMTLGGQGGGIYNDAPGVAVVNQCTLSGNSCSLVSGFGGGIFTYGTLAISNSIVAANTSIQPGSDIYIYSPSTVSFGGSNIVINLHGTSSGTTPLNASPQLAPLGNYGGLTQTMPPLAGSPAIDSGSDSAINTFPTDQRGYPRFSGVHVDVGAVEAQIAIDFPTLENPTVAANGTFAFTFTNLVGGSFTVFATTNLALPLNQWAKLGLASEIPTGSGQFQFIDSLATNSAEFYRASSP